jgi:hypothetical protein
MNCDCNDRTAWVVEDYRCNYSAFNGYRRTPSRYSRIRCTRCRGTWRSRARYVDTLPRQDGG